MSAPATSPSPSASSSLPRFVIEVVDVNGAWAGVEEELASLCSPLAGVRLKNALGTPVDLAPLPVSFLPSTDPRLSRLRKHSSSPAAWFRNPVATLLVIGGDDADDWKRGGLGLGRSSGGNDVGPSSPFAASPGGRAAARAVAERAPDPLSGPGDWAVIYVPPNREAGNRGGSSRRTTTATEGGNDATPTAASTPTSSPAATLHSPASLDAVASSKAALRMFQAVRSEFSTRRHERCVRVSDDDGDNGAAEVSLSSTSPSRRSLRRRPAPAWAAQLSRLLASAASQALAARSEAYSKAGRSLSAAQQSAREEAAKTNATSAAAATARGTDPPSPPPPSFAPLFLAKDSRAAMLSAAGMIDEAVAEYAELEALHASFFGEGRAGSGDESDDDGEGDEERTTSFLPRSFTDDATVAFASPWTRTRREAFRACSSRSDDRLSGGDDDEKNKSSSRRSRFLGNLGVREGVFARRAALLSSAGRHAELVDAGARFVSSASASLKDERRRKKSSSSARLLSLLPEAWTASACIALAEAAVRRPRSMAELVDERSKSIRGGSGGGWGLSLGGNDGASSAPTPPLSASDPLDRALAARAGDLYLAARDELGRLLVSASPSSSLFPSFSLPSSMRQQQQLPLESAAAAASLAGGGSVAGLSSSPSRTRGGEGGGVAAAGERSGSDGNSSSARLVISRTSGASGSGVKGGAGGDGHLLATAGGGAGSAEVAMSVAAAAPSLSLPRVSAATDNSGNNNTAVDADATSNDGGKAPSVAGSDGAHSGSSSSQQHQKARAPASQAAPAPATAGAIRPFLARAAELGRFRSATTTTAATADPSVSAASASATAGAAPSVADWSSDPSAIEQEIASEGEVEEEEEKEDVETNDADSGPATPPRLPCPSPSPSLAPSWLSDPRLRRALSSPQTEGASLWLALGRAAAAAFAVAGRPRRAAAVAASSSAAAAAAACSSPPSSSATVQSPKELLSGAGRALVEEAALVSRERWDRLSAAVLPALLEMPLSTATRTAENDGDASGASPATALQALSLREGLLPRGARERAQALIAAAVEEEGSGEAGRAIEERSFLDGGTALTVLPVAGMFSKGATAAAAAAASLENATAAATAGSAAVLSSVGDGGASVSVDVASRLPLPLERVRPVLVLALLQEVAVVAGAADGADRPSPPGPSKGKHGGGGFSSEWRETDAVECFPEPPSRLVTLGPGTTTRLRFSVLPLARGAYALKELRLELFSTASVAAAAAKAEAGAGEDDEEEDEAPPPKPSLVVVAPRAPRPALSSVAVPRPDVLLFASAPRAGVRLQVPAAPSSSPSATTKKEEKKLVAGVGQWVPLASFEAEGEAPSPLSSASLFVAPRVAASAASSQRPSAAGGGSSRRASLFGTREAQRAPSPRAALARALSSASLTTKNKKKKASAWSLSPGAPAVAMRISASASDSVACVAEADSERGGSWLRVRPTTASSLPVPDGSGGEGEGAKTLVWLWVEPKAEDDGVEEEAGNGELALEGADRRVSATSSSSMTIPLLIPEVPPSTSTRRHVRGNDNDPFLALPLTRPRCSPLEADVLLEYSCCRRRSSSSRLRSDEKVKEEEESSSEVAAATRTLASRLSLPAAPPLELSARLALLLPPSQEKKTKASAVLELRVSSRLPFAVVLREASLLPQAGLSVAFGGGGSPLSAPLPLTLPAGATASLACVVSDKDDDEGGGGAPVDGDEIPSAAAALLRVLGKRSSVSVSWEASASSSSTAGEEEESVSPPPPPPSSSCPLRGTVSADFFVDAPLAASLPFEEEVEESRANEQATSPSTATVFSLSDKKKRKAKGPLVAVRFLGPFSATNGAPTTLFWRIERKRKAFAVAGCSVVEGTEMEAPSTPSSSSSNSFRFEVRAQRGGGWELPGALRHHSPPLSRNGRGRDESDDDEERESDDVVVSGTVRLPPSAGASAVVEASWTPATKVDDGSSTVSLRAPTLVVFGPDGSEVGKSDGGGVGSVVGGDEFVSVFDERKNRNE